MPIPKKPKFIIISMATYGKGLSGGDRIWIEIAKILGKKYSASVCLWEEGKAIAEREGLKNVNFVLWSAKGWAKLGFFINYFARIFIACSRSFSMKIENSPQTIIYSASEFWQDTIPALILKFRFPKVRWIYFHNKTNKKITIPEQRNLGIKKARGDIIVFIDANCVPRKNWLVELTMPIFKDNENIVA